MTLPQYASLYEHVVAHASETPDAIAIVDGEDRISYRELLVATRRARALLAAKGVSAGDLVGIALPRGWWVLCAILATISHGCGYVPLDPDYPPDRLSFMARDSGAHAAFVLGDSLALPAEIARIDLRSADQLEELTLPPATLEAETPMYVIYTSGSTGAPKGVAVSERAVLALFRSADQVFSFSAHDVWTAFHSYSFDMFVWEMWGALLYGGQVVCVPTAVARHPANMLRLLVKERVTVLNQVPSVFKHLVRAYELAPQRLALPYVIFGGEALDRIAVHKWLSLRPDCEQIVNMYGITETTVHSTYRRVQLDDVTCHTGGTNIGRPLAHLEFALLDSEQRPVELEAIGEIYLTGGALANGYWKRPELTAQRFPLLSHGGQERRWYRSGDLARERADGTLEYIGRVDRQIKLRGFRVELGEIEATIRRLPEVADACIEAKCTVEGVWMLTAHVATDETASAHEFESVLRQHCSRALPHHMVPNRFVVLRELPVTPSGKLDRAQLEATRTSHEHYVNS